MNKEQKREYQKLLMRRIRKEEKLKREANTERIREYRDKNKEKIRTYTREQVAEWRKKLAVLKAAKVYVEGKSVTKQYEEFVKAT